MCQLCSAQNLIVGDRWPKPLENDKARIVSLVGSVHDGFETYRLLIRRDSSLPLPSSLLRTIQLIDTLLEKLTNDLEQWWMSKLEMRDRFRSRGELEKLRGLERIHDDTEKQIEAIGAKVGMFVKWSLGFNGGLEALKELLEEEDAEEVRKAKEIQKVEKARLNEDARKLEEVRKSKRQAEKLRHAEEARKAEEAVKAKEAQKMNEAVKAVNAKKNKKTRRAEERIRKGRSNLLSAVQSEMDSKKSLTAVQETPVADDVEMTDA